jgi:Tol biopolymer transport system component
MYLAKVKSPGTAAVRLKAVIVRLEEPPAAPQSVDVDQAISLPPQFTPDGDAIAYPIRVSTRESDGDNLWLQPLDGSPKHRLTNFPSDQTRVFSWSHNGKTLGIVRTRVDSDIVLLRESAAAAK